MKNIYLFNSVLFISIIFFSSSYLFSFPLESDSFSKIIQNTISGVVSIKAYKKSNDTTDSYFTSSKSTTNSTETSIDDSTISLGSGFIIKIDTSKIYILTTYHVVKSYNYISIIFYTGKRHQAKLYKYDSSLDLALLTVNNPKEKTSSNIEGIKSLILENNNNLDIIKPGDFILSIGNQNGLVNTANTGIISFIGRKIKNYTNLIQLDIRMDSGNSGSPIFNLDSKVIGISVGINNNTSFAISTKTIHTFLSKINLNK